MILIMARRVPIPRPSYHSRNATPSGARLFGVPASTSAALPYESPPFKESQPILPFQYLPGQALRSPDQRNIVPRVQAQLFPARAPRRNMRPLLVLPRLALLRA